MLVSEVNEARNCHSRTAYPLSQQWIHTVELSLKIIFPPPAYINASVSLSLITCCIWFPIYYPLNSIWSYVTGNHSLLRSRFLETSIIGWKWYSLIKPFYSKTEMWIILFFNKKNSKSFIGDYKARSLTGLQFPAGCDHFYFHSNAFILMYIRNISSKVIMTKWFSFLI